MQALLGDKTSRSGTNTALYGTMYSYGTVYVHTNTTILACLVWSYIIYA